eukprot:14791248-Alexandrium_andersonii.AAC.1
MAKQKADVDVKPDKDDPDNGCVTMRPKKVARNDSDSSSVDWLTPCVKDGGGGARGKSKPARGSSSHQGGGDASGGNGAGGGAAPGQTPPPNISQLL